MPVVSQSGLFNFQAFTDVGLPAAAYRVYTYLPGTTTNTDAYTDSAGIVPHTYTNDGVGGRYIATNTRGELPAPLFFLPTGADVVLKTSAGVSVWTRRVTSAAQEFNFPAFSAYANADQSITTSVFTKVLFQVEEFDTNANFASSAFSPTIAGYYSVEGVIRVSGTNISRVAIGLYKNGSEISRLVDAQLPNVSLWTDNVSSYPITMDGSSDSLELWVYVVGTSPVVAYAAPTDTSRFSGRYVRNNG